MYMGRKAIAEVEGLLQQNASPEAIVEALKAMTERSKSELVNRARSRWESVKESLPTQTRRAVQLQLEGGSFGLDSLDSSALLPILKEEMKRLSDLERVKQ